MNLGDCQAASAFDHPSLLSRLCHLQSWTYPGAVDIVTMKMTMIISMVHVYKEPRSTFTPMPFIILKIHT